MATRTLLRASSTWHGCCNVRRESIPWDCPAFRECWCDLFGVRYNHCRTPFPSHHQPTLVTQGNLEEAKPLYERSLAIDEKALGPDHPAVATDLNTLARLLQSQVGVDPLEVLDVHNYWCVLVAVGWTTAARHSPCDDNPPSGSQGNYEEAKALYERSLGIREKVLGHDHPDVAQDFINLAGFLLSQVRVDPLEVRTFHVRSCDIVKLARPLPNTICLRHDSTFWLRRATRKKLCSRWLFVRGF